MVFITKLVLLAFTVVSFQLAEAAPRAKTSPRVVYPKKSELDLEAAEIEGEVRNPGEFYFQHRREEKMDSLVKRRPNFHREMLRDAVMMR